MTTDPQPNFTPSYDGLIIGRPHVVEPREGHSLIHTSKLTKSGGVLAEVTDYWSTKYYRKVDE